jgi:hypothetical protein
MGQGMRWIDGGLLVEKSMKCFRGDTLVQCEQVSGEDGKDTYLRRLPSIRITPSKCITSACNGRASPGPGRNVRKELDPGWGVP